MYSSNFVWYGCITTVHSENRPDMQTARVLCMFSAEFIGVKAGDGVTTEI